MSKFLLAALLGLSSTAACAQTSLPAGTWQLGGSINYSRQHNETTGSGTGSSNTYSYFTASPTVGYLVANNLAVGLMAGYSLNKNQGADGYNLSSSEQISKAVFGGLFADYYRLLGPYFGLKGRLAASYSRNSYDYNNAGPNGASYSRNTGYSLGTNLVPSLLFFPVPKLALEASLGGLYYSYGRATSSPNVINGDSRSNNFAANFGLSYLTLGGTFFPGRR